jgi:hypothetical protein
MKKSERQSEVRDGETRIIAKSACIPAAPRHSPLCSRSPLPRIERARAGFALLPPAWNNDPR